MGRDKKKEKYRMIPILLLMKCIRPILREIIIGYAKEGEKHWTVDDFLGHYRKKIERKIQTFDDYDNFLSVLYPSDGRSDFGKWNLKLTTFILKDVCEFDSNFKYYIGDILNIRDQLCVPHTSGITRIVSKEYKRRLKSARSHFYRLLHSDDLKKTIERRAHNIKNEMKNKDILRRWEKLEKDIVPNACGKNGVQRYLTLNILLSETCCEVMQGLIKKKVKEKGHRSIDKFLWEHEKRIRRRISTLDAFGRAEDMLLPPKGQRVNMYEWDVTLLCWVLLNVGFLDEGLADAIGSVRRVRNKTIHKLSTSMNVSELKYQKYFEDIKKSIDTCLMYFDDADFSEDIHNKIEEIDRSGVDKDETIRRLQLCQSDRVDHELQNKHLRGQGAIIEELSQILKTIGGFELPACTLEVMLQNCSEECEKELSNILVEKINRVISENAMPENRSDELTTAIKDFVDRYKEKGWKPICAENGSVLFKTKCNSFSSLCQLYETHRNEGFRPFVSTVEDAVQHMLGRRVHLCVVMHSAEMDKCMATIVSSIYDRIKETETRVNKLKTANKGINIWMALNGEESSQATFGKDDKGFVERLTHIADILQKRYQTPNLTVTATLRDFSEVSCENWIDKEGTSCDYSEKEETLSDINEKMQTEVICVISGSCSDENDRMLCDFSGKERVMSNKIRTMKSTDTALAELADECQENKEKEAQKEVCDLEEGIGAEYSTNIFGPLVEVTKEEVWKADNSFELLLDGMQEVDTAPRIDQVDVENLRMDLISFYRRRISHICLSPLPCHETANIDDLFVPLNIERHFLHSITKFPEQDQYSVISEVTDVTSYYDILYCNGHLNRKIYVTGAAGCGKTTFCKKLVSDWCKSWHKEFSAVTTLSQYDAGNQINRKYDGNPLLRFDLVFLVFLKETMETTVEAMISNQLGFSEERLAECLLNRECLIILDGLDEWKPSEGSETAKIPLLQLPNRCTTLVTSRGSILDLQANACENFCEIAIKDRGSNSNMLIRSILQTIFKSKYSLNRYDIYAEQFLNEVKTRNIGGLLNNLYVLKILLCLWLQKGKIDPSSSELYEKISRTLIKKACLKDSHGKGATSTISLCTTKCVKCRICAGGSSIMLSLLQSLAKLAYFNLFSESGNSRPSLHFQELENDLTSSEREILLRSGIISQNDRFLYKNLSKYVFVHKTFQEYFAAAYISSNPEICMRELILTCRNFKKGFELSNIFLFLGIMNPDAMKSVYYYIDRLTDGDERNEVYKFLCDNGRLVENSYLLLISPLDGLVVNAIDQRLSFLFRKTKLSDLFGDICLGNKDAATASPNLLYILNTYFDNKLLIATRKDFAFLQLIVQMTPESDVEHFVQSFERRVMSAILGEDLEQPFACPTNCDDFIFIRCCDHADDKFKSKVCKHSLVTRRSIFYSITCVEPSV